MSSQRTMSFVALALSALLLVVAACGTTTGSSTTEALSTLASTAPLETTSTPNTSAPESSLTAVQQETLDNLLAAYASGDSAEIMSLWTRAGEHYRPDIEFDLAIGGRWSDVACDVSLSGEPRCEFLYTNSLLEALDAPPLAGYFRIEMDSSGAIADWDYQQGNRATAAAYIQPFSDWVRETDPEAADDMFDWNGFARRIPDAYVVWEQKVEEFLATLG
ncbi:MAG: hypothetical protein HKN91_03085 [Acidimicrobiia bacterium]|nr:hypothetical protein [Acidimicrobiia bacterium]